MNTNQSSKSTVIPLNKKWIELTLPNKKKLYYNKADDTVTIYPPFPKKALSTFLQVYNLGITESDFNSLLTQAITSRQTQAQNEPVDSTPLSELSSLRSLEELSKYENIEKVLLQLFKIKYNVNPNYEYSSKDQDAKQRCTIKVKGANLLTGKEGKNKQEAKELVDRETLMLLLPWQTYERIRKNQEELKNKMIIEEEGELFDINETQPVIENRTHIPNGIQDNQYSLQKEDVTTIFKKPLYTSPTPMVSSTSSSTSTNSAITTIASLTSDPFPKKTVLGLKHERDNSNPFPSKPHQPFYQEEIISGSFIDDENYEELDIDSPKVLNQYKGTYKHSPSEMVNILKRAYPSLDITISSSNNNGSIKIKNIQNRTTVRTEIYSKQLGISAIANENNKADSIQVCSQRFLKKVYQNKFTKWVELNDFFKKKKGYLDHLGITK